MNPLTHADLVQLAMKWARTERRCKAVLTERGGGISGERCDVIAWAGMYSSLPTCVVIECKASLADFHADLSEGEVREARRLMGLEAPS